MTCLEKCLEALHQGRDLVICEEYAWETVVDTVLELRERGYKAHTYWGDVLMSIHLG